MAFYITGDERHGYQILLQPGYPPDALNFLKLMSSTIEGTNERWFPNGLNLDSVRVFEDGAAAIGLPQGQANLYVAFIKTVLGAKQIGF